VDGDEERAHRRHADPLRARYRHHEDVERVAVVGPGGAGKSTFAVALGRRTGLPVVHLDRLFWRPGWEATPHDEWLAAQGAVVAADRWIVDGNYSGTIDLRLARADTVVILDPGRVRSLAGALGRTMRNRGRELQADGCPEHLDVEFLRWIWDYPTRSRPRIDEAVARHGHLSVVELRSRQEASDFVEQLG
jgi:adenylate kinase family enzyme